MFLNTSFRLVYIELMGGNIFDVTDRKSLFTLLLTNHIERSHSNILLVWTMGFLKEVMAVSSPGMHAIACYSHHVLLGGPLLSLPHEGTCSCQSR